MGKSGKYVKWICIILGVALLACAVLIGAVRSSKENEDWHYINGHYYDRIPFHADIINPETEESLYKKGSLEYQEVHLTYDGSAKTFEIHFRQNHDNKIVDVTDYKIYMTLVEPETGRYLYNQKEIREKGEYYFNVEALEYNEEKYAFCKSSSLHVFID